MKKRLVPIYLLIIAVSCFAQTIDGDLQASIEAIMEEAGKDKNTMGITLTLVSSDEVLFQQGYGLADQENQREVTPSTPFHTASVSKIFTAVAVMQLVEQGLVDLEKPITHYLSGLELPGWNDADIQVGDLLSHHSAFSSDMLLNNISAPLDQHNYPANLYAALNSELPTQGRGYRYSNLGYELLGLLISEVSGLDYDCYIEDFILIPLGMTNTALTGNEAALHPAVSQGYSQGEVYEAINLRGRGAEGVMSCSRDMSRFAQAFLNGGTLDGYVMLQESSLEMLWSRWAEPQTEDFGHPMGLGWHRGYLPAYPSIPFYYHDGGLYPFSASLVIVPSQNIAVFLAANSDEKGLESLGIDLLQRVVEHQGSEMEIPVPRNRSQDLRSNFYGNYATELGWMEVYQGLAGPKLRFFGMGLNLVPEENGYWGLRFRLLGFIPISMGDMGSIRLSFQVRDGIPRFAIYQDGRFRGIGSMISERPVSEPWHSRMGSYSIANNEDPSFVESFRLFIDDQSGLPMMGVRVATIEEEIELPLDLSRSERAVIEGEGRHLGDSIQVLENGNLLYSGLELTLD